MRGSAADRGPAALVGSGRERPGPAWPGPAWSGPAGTGPERPCSLPAPWLQTPGDRTPRGGPVHRDPLTRNDHLLSRRHQFTVDVDEELDVGRHRALDHGQADRAELVMTSRGGHDADLTAVLGDDC